MKHLSLIAVILVFGFFSVSAHAQILEDPTIKPLPEFLDHSTRDETLPQADEVQKDNAIDMAAPEATKPESDLSDIPDEFIIEASDFAEECRNDHTMPMYYDCRCLSVAYLDERIRRGPESGADSIRRTITKQCKDASGIAGQIYEHCLTDFVNAPKHLDPEEYCSCYGNTYAKYYEGFDGLATARVNISIKARAKTVCADPAAARRVYGRGAVPLNR